jgi:hypothetical protein
MTDYATFDPSSGQRVDAGAGPAAHSQAGSSFKDQWYGGWPPGNVESSDPHDQPAYETGDSPTTGPIPGNIVGGELRAADDDFDGDFEGEGDGLDRGDLSDDGDCCGEDLDGDGVAQDSPDLDVVEGDGKPGNIGPTAGNIRAQVSAEALRQAGGIVPGPLSRSRH